MVKYITRYVDEYYESLKVRKGIAEKLREIAKARGVTIQQLLEEVLSEYIGNKYLVTNMGLMFQSNQLYEVEKFATSISISYSVNEDVKRKLYEIRPKTVIYMFSGGKDSSLALLFTRDFVKKFCEETRCRVYVLYIVIAGNTHPLNSYASAYVMEWHRVHYGFEPMYRVAPYVFQEGVAKSGLQVGTGRWCYNIHKDRVFREIEKTLPHPQLHITGMSPHDSKARSEKIKSEIQLIETSNNTRYWAWHPLFSLNLSSEEKLKILEQHEEFRPIVLLYKRFGDSLNCLVCPYKDKKDYMKLHAIEDMSIVAEFMKLVLRSERWREMFTSLNNPKKITDYIG